MSDEKKEHILASVVVAIMAIVAILILDLYAISKGMNGVGLATSVALIAAVGAGFAGIKLKDVIFK